MAIIEKLARSIKKATRKKREYTDEQRKAIRARLLAGQAAARKRREAEAKATKKVKTDKQEKVALIKESNPENISQ